MFVAVDTQDAETNISVIYVQTSAPDAAFIDAPVAAHFAKQTLIKLTSVGVAKGRKADGRSSRQGEEGSSKTE